MQLSSYSLGMLLKFSLFLSQKENEDSQVNTLELYAKTWCVAMVQKFILYAYPYEVEQFGSLLLCIQCFKPKLTLLFTYTIDH